MAGADHPWLNSDGTMALLALGAGLALCVLVWAWILPAGRRQLQADDASVFFAQLGRVWTRAIHRLTLDGFSQAARQRLDEPSGGALIVVCNHAAGVDPILVQLAMKRQVRWFMAADQMGGLLGWFWRLQGVIPVHYDRRDAQGLRSALTHLAAGGVLGAFPEGGIARPAGQLYRFMPGFASLAAKTGARVAVLSLHGIPPNAGVIRSLFVPCRARLRLLAVLEPPPADGTDAFIERVRGMIAQDLGIPASDRFLEHLPQR